MWVIKLTIFYFEGKIGQPIIRSKILRGLNDSFKEAIFEVRLQVIVWFCMKIMCV